MLHCHAIISTLEHGSPRPYSGDWSLTCLDELTIVYKMVLHGKLRPDRVTGGKFCCSPKILLFRQRLSRECDLSKPPDAKGKLWRHASQFPPFCLPRGCSASTLAERLPQLPPPPPRWPSPGLELRLLRLVLRILHAGESSSANRLLRSRHRCVWATRTRRRG